MKYLLLFVLCLTSPLFSIEVDRSARSFAMRKQNKRVDKFDFSGLFPNLENIDIDARRKKRVEFDLSGDYPLLSTVNYEGSFGNFKGALTGNYPVLEQVNLLCTSCLMAIDLKGNWQQSCQINICGQKEDITLELPDDVGLIIRTKTSPAGKVFAKKGLKKQGWFKIWKKTYYNELARTAPIVLTLDIETTEGNIILN